MGSLCVAERDGIKDRTERMLRPTTPGESSREMSLQVGPFTVREIGGILGFHGPGRTKSADFVLHSTRSYTVGYLDTAAG